MNVVEIIKIAFRALSRQKIRTSLTIFSVFIGVFLIIFLVSTSLGGKKILLEQFTSNFDLKNIQVSSVGNLGFNFNSVKTESEEIKPVTDDTLNSIKSINHVEKVQPIIALTGKSLQLEGKEKPIRGAFGAGFDLGSEDKYIKEIIAGEVKQLDENEALINYKVADAYGVDYSQIIGKTIEVKDDSSSFISAKIKDVGKTYTLKIVGIIDIGSQQLSFITSVKKAVEMQALRGGFTSNQEYINQIGYDQLYLTTDSETNVAQVASEIKALGYDAITIEEIIGIFENITSIIGIVFSMFGIIALVVASVGIINTMIMSVFERTKEIGVLKAIGANKADVRNLFLTEAATIGFLGGILGLLVSLGLMALSEWILVTKVFPASDLKIDSVFYTPLWLMIGPVIFSTIIGIVAGLYPAMRASRLKPVDALRYE